MKWKYKFWILLAATIIVLLFMFYLNKWLAIIHVIIFSILFPLVYYRQFVKK